jgi:hypothetical protein
MFLLIGALKSIPAIRMFLIYSYIIIIK